MIWDIIDIIFNFFNLFPNIRKDDDSTEHFKNLK